ALTVPTRRPVAFILLWKLLISPFSEHTRNKSWKKILGIAAFRACALSIPQTQFLLGNKPSLESYKQWSQAKGLLVQVEEIEGEDARLLWVGKKRTDKVLYYIHGGGYALPLPDYALSFWRHVQEQLEKRNINTGVVALNYALIPNAPFPTALRQAVLGLQNLLDSGIRPENIQIVGDSAGGNLILQLFSHLLHPLPDVPTLTQNNVKLNGTCLVSPWVSFRDEDRTHILRSSIDLLKAPAIREFADFILHDVPESRECYFELLKTPGSWWAGLDSKVDRVLLIAGADECFKEDIVKLDRNVRRHHKEVTLFVQEYGVHVEPYLDFMVGEKELPAITSDIVAWIAAGFSASD
ncbi:hypothetical protein V5O48_015579, partial [Marasmius crinis-equi]